MTFVLKFFIFLFFAIRMTSAGVNHIILRMGQPLEKHIPAEFLVIIIFWQRY